jgi:hypothetical protein
VDTDAPKVGREVVEKVLKDFAPDFVKPQLFSYLTKFDFFFTSRNLDYFDLEKLTVFFILYSSATSEDRSTALFYLFAEEVPTKLGVYTQMIVNRPDEQCFNRVFAYMAIITCLITTEVLRG